MKKNLYTILSFILVAVSFALHYVQSTEGGGKEAYIPEQGSIQEQEFVISESTSAAAEALELYSTSAVLIDAKSGRVLYGKNETRQLPMASTTKIMTCILALENGNINDPVTISKNAANQPKVHLGVMEGEQYYLRDLLYSLMLESHNDAAVAIAEHIGGSVEGFSKLMNQKARDLGCYNSYFVTPNGLDASVTLENGEVLEHHTTAAELAKIMSYCILSSPKKEEFLEITRTKVHYFTNLEGNRSFQAANHNAFLDMMDGALSGKTGFTNKAGYCYVGALESEGRTFAVALLASGWPNNKGYKWKDTRALMEYGMNNYSYQERNFDNENIRLPEVYVSDGGCFSDDYTTITPVFDRDSSFSILTDQNETEYVISTLPKVVNAPVKKGENLGTIQYVVGDTVLESISVYADRTIGKATLFDDFCRTIELLLDPEV